MIYLVRQYRRAGEAVHLQNFPRLNYLSPTVVLREFPIFSGIKFY